MTYEDLLSNLKRLRHVEPDPNFTQQSKLVILRAPPRRTFWALVAEHMEFGTSLALVGLLIFAFFGGFTNRDGAGPLEFSNLDIGGIRAEAEAIDVQIDLVEHAYQGSSLPTHETTTDAVPADINKPPLASSGQLRTAAVLPANSSCELERATKALVAAEEDISQSVAENDTRELEALERITFETLGCALNDLQSAEKAFLGAAREGDLEIQALAEDTERQVKKLYDAYAQNKEEAGLFGIEEHKAFAEEFAAWQASAETPLKEKMKLFLAWSRNETLFDAAERRLEQVTLTLEKLQLRSVPTISELVRQAGINLQYALTSHRSARHVFVSAYSSSDASYLIKASLDSLARTYSIFLELDKTVSVFSAR